MGISVTKTESHNFLFVRLGQGRGVSMVCFDTKRCVITLWEDKKYS